MAKEPIPPVTKIEATQEKTKVNPQEFTAQMQAAEGKIAAEENVNPTPMQVYQGKLAIGSPTLENLTKQIDDTNTQFNSLQKKLSIPKLSLKRSESSLIDLKLQKATKSISDITTDITGSSFAKTQTPQGAGPATRFLAMITDGQNGLIETQKKLQEFEASGNNLTPTKLLQIQVQLAQAQQELEYSSIILSKCIDVLKSTLNIQI